jgi:altronate dehydratase large subunit
MSFWGYVRSDGSVGTRNYVLIIPQGIIAKSVCDFVTGTKTILSVDHGSGRTANDREQIARLLIGLGRNPNSAAVIVHAASPGVGYPELRAERLVDEIAAGGKRVELVDPARDGGTYGAITKGIQLARRMAHEASKGRREPVADRHLCLGVKCGYSDTTSGIAGNPAVGYLYDKVVAAGGTALFGETTEIIGAEQVLAARAVNPEVAGKILRAVKIQEDRALATGLDIRTVNPVPSNIKGGISSLEEKSLGAIHKAGSAPIQGVLSYAERPAGKGLYFVDNWMGHLSIFAGYAAAGANVVLFQLGGGGVAGRTLLEG